MALLSYFFYRSWIAMIPMIPVGVFFYKKLKIKRIKSNKDKLERQFKECILSVSIAIKAGYAVENAFRESKVLPLSRTFLI
ncbi:MAG: hypothetical protein IJ796_05975 [Lachnospiraceae bacterium]|nr:hypothetical protein [Lachnospiraceae bacterium]